MKTATNIYETVLKPILQINEKCYQLKTNKSVLPKINALKDISIAEDLTVINYQKRQGLLKKNIKAWSLGGKIMYMNKDGTKKIDK